MCWSNECSASLHFERSLVDQTERETMRFGESKILKANCVSTLFSSTLYPSSTTFNDENAASSSVFALGRICLHHAPRRLLHTVNFITFFLPLIYTFSDVNQLASASMWAFSSMQCSERYHYFLQTRGQPQYADSKAESKLATVKDTVMRLELSDEEGISSFRLLSLSLTAERVRRMKIWILRSVWHIWP